MEKKIDYMEKVSSAVQEVLGGFDTDFDFWSEVGLKGVGAENFAVKITLEENADCDWVVIQEKNKQFVVTENIDFVPYEVMEIAHAMREANSKGKFNMVWDYYNGVYSGNSRKCLMN